MSEVIDLAHRRTQWQVVGRRDREATSAHRPQEWWLWICPVCGHYETEAGDPFTTSDATCPVERIGSRWPHPGPSRGPVLRRLGYEATDLQPPALIRVRVRA